MAETLSVSTPLQRWQGERGTYHLVTISGESAEAISMHERLHRLEFGSRRGFGSVKVMARIGGTEWKTSVFPSKPKRSSREAIARQEREWWLLVSKKVMKAEDLAEGDELTIALDLL